MLIWISLLAHNLFLIRITIIFIVNLWIITIITILAKQVTLTCEGFAKNIDRRDANVK